MPLTFIEKVNLIAANLTSLVLTAGQTFADLFNAKVDKVTGKGLSEADFSTAEKTKLSMIDMSLVEMLERKGFPNGYVPLDANGKINSQFLSSISVVDTYFPADEASMLALLQAGIGDIAFLPNIVNGGFDVFVLSAQPASTLANWKSMYLVGVTSINGQVGVVNIGTDDIPEGIINQYFTNERVDDRVAALIQAGLNISLVYDDVNGTFTISGIDAYTKTETDTNIAAAISALVAASPAALDTLNELSAALGNDANFATTITNALSLKVGKDSNTGAMSVPAGTTLERKAVPIFGDQRANSTLTAMEWWDGTAWSPMGGTTDAVLGTTLEGLLI